MSQYGASGRYHGQSLANGRYQLRDLLGEGGMASVHLAYDSVLDRQVAIKTLHTELGREQSFRERFRREAQAVAKLTHTNIVSVFDTGEDSVDGSLMPYIVMEYVEGQPLRAVLDTDVRQYGAMPTEKALKITGDVLAALEISHEMGLVHRDIKPGNVMMTKRNVVKVMDFGIARAMQSGVTSMTQTGMVVGTPQYLSPEQALGRGVDARSDLYSVGIMLFELLTGRLPFDADSPLAIAYAHVQEEPVAPSTINQSIPPAVDALVARALKKNPNERFPTAEAMRDECARVARTGQTGASPIIISGGPPARSGVGVGSAVFPPIDQQTPAPGPGSVQTPYQPQPSAGQYGAFGPSTPAPVTPPMGQHGYQTPTPSYQGPSTPPPYSISPSAPSGGGGNGNKRVIIGSAVVAAVAVIAVVLAIAFSGDGGSKDESKGGGGGGGKTSKPSASDTASGFRMGDKAKTIETSKCTDAYEDSDEKGTYSVPDFQNLYIDSVKKCIRAAGWKYRVVTQDENLWGKGTVLNYTYRNYEPYNPKTDTIELTVSTGNPG
ncbi:serine/threonine-protein kinase PksC [Streptomyces antimycoticus]|uniref:non-specific serine/threonine protein kinase n=1 Tax=Streptomyces antimycoticus TaxID=68175 RepID=A0A499UYI1_9ACTN|nr:protein kinase [Streptomyces antimycoticus]BBJ42331.1 serine/threonine-protein kinase PksC [Streptomyces antimycoticus]